MQEQMDEEQQSQRGRVRRFAEEAPGPSVLGAVAEIAEQAEESTLGPAGIDPRLERFPELRGLEVSGADPRFERLPELRGITVAAGSLARFPELAEDPQEDTREKDRQQPVQPGAHGR